MIIVITTTPVLRIPNWSKDLVIDCDASDQAVGNVLSQIGDDGEEHPMYFCSRFLNTWKQNYSVTDRECLVVIAGVKKSRVSIPGRWALIRTDHGAVWELLNYPEAIGRRARWMAIMNEFDFVLEHRARTSHGNADTMSRMFLGEEGRHSSN